MISILDKASIRKEVLPISVADYHKLGEAGILREDVELLDSVIVKKNPKSPLHEFLVARLFGWLQSFIHNGGWDHLLIRKEGPLALDPSEPEPDLSVVEGRPEDFLKSHPTTAKLVIEVAVTTLARDQWKAKAYSKARVEEYWLIDVENRSIYQMTEPDPCDSEYRRNIVASASDSVTSCTLPGFGFRLDDFFPAGSKL